MDDGCVSALSHGLYNITSQPTEDPANALVVKKSTLHGKGLFTQKDIEVGTLIIQYTGPIISEADADTYPEERQVFFFGHADEGKVIDGSVDSNKARWINHKCGQNNCEIIHQPEYADYPWVTARRNIKAGEELTYSYGRDFWSKACSSDRFCNCGTPHCYGSKQAKEAALERERERFWEC